MIYLDYAASTPVDPRVAEAMIECLRPGGAQGNPSSAGHVNTICVVAPDCVVANHRPVATVRYINAMGTPGRTRSVAGVPPLRVSLGLASAVSAQVDDRPIVIPRRAGKDAAKFLIEADGAVRPDFSSKTAERE